MPKDNLTIFSANEVGPAVYDVPPFLPDEKEIDLSEIFPPGEHGIYAYYGRIGQGKTYAMTADILDALKHGQVVYSNYPINWDGYDQRSNLMAILAGLLLMRREFYEFEKSNLHFIEVDERFHDRLAELTDCIVALDEGYVAFDSYEMAKMSMKKRKNVLHTRHFDRSIWYTTQRPNAVHVTMRAQTNVFYKITKIWSSFGIIVFRRQELDLGSDDSVDEKNVYSTKYYFGQSRIFNAYNTKYLRYGARASQPVNAIIHRPSYPMIVQLLWKYAESRVPQRLKALRPRDFMPLLPGLSPQSPKLSTGPRLSERLPLSTIGQSGRRGGGAASGGEESGDNARQQREKKESERSEDSMSPGSESSEG